MEKETPTAKDFNLSKVKLLPTGGVSVEYSVTQVVENEASVLERKETCTRDVHPDLRELFVALRAIVAEALGLTAFVRLMQSEDFKKMSGAQKEAMADFAIEMQDRVDVRGIAWSGADANIGVVISAVLETGNGLKTAVNTPRIKLAQLSFGFEENLEALTDAVKREVYAYLYEGKQAQLSLFGDQPGEEEEDPFDAPEE